jgi:hypothetical protein
MQNGFEVFLIPYYLVKLVAYAAPIAFMCFCFWKAAKSGAAEVVAIWGVIGFLPIFYFVWNNGSADRLQAERIERAATMERISVRGRHFTRMVVYGSLSNEGMLMMSRMFKIQAYYLVEPVFDNRLDDPYSGPYVNATIYSFQGGAKCREYGDYLVRERTGVGKAATASNARPMDLNQIYADMERQRQEIKSVFVPANECVKGSQLKLKKDDLPKDAIYYGSAAVPSLMNKKMLKGRKAELRVYADNELKLVEYFETRDTERQSSPFCLPIGDFCKRSQANRETVPDLISMLHHATTGRDIGT